MSSFFEKSAAEIAETLQHQKEVFGGTYKEVWEKWMHPALTEQTTFEEVMKHIVGN